MFTQVVTVHLKPNRTRRGHPDLGDVVEPEQIPAGGRAQRQQDLRQQGRSASGGWPGTMREARMRVGSALRVEIHGQALPALTEVEREVAARKVYASARRAWCKSVDR